VTTGGSCTPPRFPANDPHWTASGGLYTFRDANGTFGRIVRFEIGLAAQGIRASVQVRGAGLGSAADAVTSASITVLRAVEMAVR
jgi:hypothetical protein